MATKSVNVNEKVTVPAKQQTPGLTVKDYINKYEKYFAKALPAVMSAERFTRIAITAVEKNPDLGACTPSSLMGALLTSAQLGLEVNTPMGEAYLIPYKNYRKNGILECQFQIGYKGLISLAHRSGEFQSIEAHVVRENDTFEYELGLEPKLKHKPAMKDRGEITWVYAIYKLKSGGFGFEVMSVDDINEFRKKFSKAKNSPWDTNWEAMAKKTVIKQALKYAPLKTEFVREMTNEDVTLNFDENDLQIFSDEDTRYADEAVTVDDVETVENK